MRGRLAVQVAAKNAGTGSHLEMTPGTDAAGVQFGGSGMSGNAGTGSHLEEADAAEGHAGQVEGLGSSRNAGIGSHLAGVGFSDEPWAVMWRRSPSRRTESGLLLYGTASLDCAVQKTALWCTRGSSQLRGRARRGQQRRSSCRTDDGRKRKPVADCSGAGAAEAHEGEVAAEGYAGQVEGLGSSRNAGIGSHLAGTDFSDEPWAVMWRRPPPRRTESGLLSYGTASPGSSVQKMALRCTRGSSQRRGRTRR